MGITDLGMKKYLLLLLLLSLAGCKKSSPLNSAVPADEKELSFEEAIYLIHEHRLFELKNNSDVYYTLINESNQYYSDLTNQFLEKEYSLSGSFSEIGHIVNKTPEERFAIWQVKLNSYYSSSAYERFINSRIENHYRNLNKQRRIGLEKPLVYISEDSLEIKKVSLNEFQASQELISQSIIESNKKIKENLRRLAYNGAEVASLLVTGGTSGTVLLSVEGAGMTEMAYDFVVPDKNETREVLEKEYTSFLEKNNIDFTQKLNENTNKYYSKLLELINKRKNEKILF